MNKTVIFITFSALAALGIVGTAILLILRPDATATFTAFIATVLGLVSVAAAQFYGFGKQNEKLETIKTQTNGTLSALHEENTRLTNLLIEQGVQIAPKGKYASDAPPR
jgi:hypothetical protein